MNLKNKFAGIALASMMSLSSLSTNVFAIETDVIDEMWGKPTVVYGGGLSDDQVAQTQSLFHISNPDNVYNLVVVSDDLGRYLNFWGADTSSLISSVMVKKTGSNGVVVNILTPENITNITSQQYANAAITAGVYNCEIDVASIQRVTGESALTGVYKAFEANGEVLDPERTAIAQDELEMTETIANESEGIDGFDAAILDQTMVEIKQEMAQIKEQNGTITYEDIVNIVYRILEKYGLQDLLSQENIDWIINFASQYANTSAIDSEEVLRQLDNLAQNLSGTLSTLYSKAKESGIIDRIIAFIKDLVQEYFG